MLCMPCRQATSLTAVLLLLTALCAACGPAPLPAAVPTPTATATATPGPTPAPIVTVDCLTQPGRIEGGSLADGLAYQVYLPPCYVSDGPAYPVLYLLHGLGYDEGQWLRLGAAEAADRLVASGGFPRFIIVFPRDPSSRQPGEDPFEAAFLDELIPFIDATYHTRTDRAGRAVGGLSRGAGWAIHLGLGRADLFAAVGGHSPVIFYGDVSQIPGWLDELPEETRVYLDSGENDQDLKNTRWLEQLLTDHGVPHEWHLNTGFHDEAYWSAHVEQYLRWYAAGW